MEIFFTNLEHSWILEPKTKPLIFLCINLIMDTFTKIPGLQHISEDIFKLLDKKDLLDCRLVTSSWKMILDQPKFWLEKLKSDDRYLDDVAQKIWENLVHEVNDDQLKKELVLIMIKLLGVSPNLPMNFVRRLCRRR